MVVAILVALVVSAFGIWWSLTGDGPAAAAPNREATPASTAVTAAEPDPGPASHITFGSHTTATQPCATCHPDDPKPGSIVCRDCHGDMCGKDAKTVADCLECHKTGTTQEWAP